ncbi:hypothetical protein [Sphingobium chungangianum]
MKRISIMHEQFREALDWIAMERDEQLRITHHGQAIEHHLCRVGEAIDQRIFELAHERDESLAMQPLDDFHANVAALADAAIHETRGASYELYARRFTDACEPLLNALDAGFRDAGRAVAIYHGYIDGEHAGEGDFGTGTCPLSGIDADCCHCGRHP